MTLQFHYQPPPKIRFVRTRDLSFHDTIASYQMPKDNESVSIPKEVVKKRKHKSDDSDYVETEDPQIKESAFKTLPQKTKVFSNDQENLSSQNKHFEDEKTPKITQSEVTYQSKKGIFNIEDDSLQSFYNLLSELKKSGFKELFGLLENSGYRSRNHDAYDLSTIESRLIAGDIIDYPSFKHEIFECLSRISKDFGHETHYAQLSYQLTQELANSFEQLDQKINGHSHSKIPSNIIHALNTFSNTPELIDSVKTSSSFDISKIKELKKRLQSLDPSSKLRAEWIIRISSPTLPYYSLSVDLQDLPKEALDKLCELVNLI